VSQQVGHPSRQHGDLELGEVFVQGKDPDMARRLLAACEELGVEALEVRTTMQGFVVPGAFWDRAQDNQRAEHGLTI
jgi:hypothetical protein